MRCVKKIRGKRGKPDTIEYIVNIELVAYKIWFLQPKYIFFLQDQYEITKDQLADFREIFTLFDKVNYNKLFARVRFCLEGWWWGFNFQWSDCCHEDIWSENTRSYIMRVKLLKNSDLFRSCSKRDDSTSQWRQGEQYSWVQWVSHNDGWILSSTRLTLRFAPLA